MRVAFENELLSNNPQARQIIEDALKSETYADECFVRMTSAGLQLRSSASQDGGFVVPLAMLNSELADSLKTWNGESVDGRWVSGLKKT